MELYLQVLYIASFCLLLTLVTAQNYATCDTSESCIPLDRCPILSQRVLESNNRSFNDISYLRSKQCGFTYPQVLVCCEIATMVRYATNELGKSGKVGAKTAVGSNDNGKSRGASLPNVPECGPVFANRVVGGRTASIYEFPWMAMLEYTKGNNVKVFACGGSLINYRYVLTAAHCVEVDDMRLTGVRLGEWDKSMDPDCEISPSGQKNCANLRPINLQVAETIVHEKYERLSNTPRYDIALLRLASEVDFTDLVRPICLPKAGLMNEYFNGFKMDVAGWGITEKNAASNVKLKAELGIWDLDKCRKAYDFANISLIDSQMCAGGERGVDACGGDSGGPLMTVIDNAYTLAGIISYGPIACGTPDQPGVFTRVAAFSDWISQQLKP